MFDYNANLQQLFRTDALTGVGNLIGFYENLYARMKNEPDSPFSIISIDICGLKEVNDNMGRSAGDSTIRWFALVLSEELDGDVFRIGGDEFAVIVNNTTQDEMSTTLESVIKRLNKEATQANLIPPAAHIAVVNYKEFTEWSLVRTMGIFYNVLDKKREMEFDNYVVYEADEIPELKGLNTTSLDMIEKLARVGEILDQSLTLAYNDTISGLPNMNAAMQYLDGLEEEFTKSDLVFSMLLIDGDNLGEYNRISYIRGDQMIRNLGEVLKLEMRPNDFVARWRSGDEFIIVLPETSLEIAQNVGNRLRVNVKKASQGWQFPITISLGVSCYPINGNSINELIDCAEMALRLAKEQGKDRVAIIE
jgi:diguanylate cyclase (GGDEF)-like protein